MVPRHSNHAHLPMRNNHEPPVMPQALQGREHVLFTAQSYHTLPPFAFPRGRNASEDADAETVSIHSESRSPTNDSTDTALQDVDIEGEDFGASSNSLRTPSTDTAIARSRSECLQTVSQAGYFVFPDPFSSGGRASSTPDRIRSYAATSSEDEGFPAEDESDTEDYVSSSQEDVSLGQGAEQDSAPPPDKETSQFLPLLKDEPNYARDSALKRGLEKINKRLREAKTCLEEPHTQSDNLTPAPGIHPAFRQAESQCANDIKTLAALRADIKRLEAEVRALERSVTSTDSCYAEVIKNVLMNQERLVGGWERMRHELFRIKVMQERLRWRVDTDRNMEGHW